LGYTQNSPDSNSFFPNGVRGVRSAVDVGAFVCVSIANLLSNRRLSLEKA
jgi:hypothetical protein